MNPISQSKFDDVARRLEALGVTKEVLREEFIRGSGAGGQKINKTNSCVQLTHTPSGIVIRCQHTRSREQNRFFARRILCERLEAIQLGKKSEKEKRLHRIRAQKRRRSRRAKDKMLSSKKFQGEKKKQRKKPAENGE
ncbi:MAG: hypothetical protein ACD_62C00013G0003 [uncultured bacterium]|nr:MAG: hypothetical protein ACD_62C00013G0003 [uncultured bacterium]HLD44209.1 peptide chain release factor-like protein [bacterium]